MNGTGTAVWPESTLSAGVYNIVARYNGDPNFGSSSSSPAQLTVTKRTGSGPGGAALTVTANDASRTTTETNPQFSYTISGTLVNGDSYGTAVTGTPTYTAYTGSTPGSYPITVTALTSANYVIGFVAGTLTVVSTPTTTTSTASPNSLQYGDLATLTATVSPALVSGTMNFYDGTVYLGSGTVTGGAAALTTALLSAGPHSIKAIYNGDGTYASSASSPTIVEVAKRTGTGPGGAALTATVENASREYGAANPEFVYVLSGTLVNGDTYATTVTGVPVYSVADTPTSPPGSTFPITVSGLVSQNYVLASVPGTLTIVPAITTTTLSVSATSVQYGNPVTLTATVNPAATGMVDFVSGSRVVAQATLSGGAATLTSTAIPADTYVVTAIYLGDGNYSSSTSGPVTLTVTKRTGSGPGGAALTVTVNNASRAYGQGNPAFSYAVAGMLVNNDTYATAVTGVPVYSTPATVTSPVGSYPVSVSSLSSDNYELAFVNGTLTVTKGTPAVPLSSSSNPSTYGASISFTTILSAGATGAVTFLDGTTTLCSSVVISAATATCTTSTLAAGTHSVTAQYSGDTNYNSSTSLVLSQTVTKATLGSGGVAGVTLASSSNPSIAGTPVTFTATIPAGATGIVTFLDVATALGTGTISAGKATYATSTLAVGMHPITSVYGGDSNYNGATSAVLSQVITQQVAVSGPDFTLASSTGPQLIPPGASASYTIVVSSMNAPFTSSVTMSASNLPPGATYTFSPVAVTPGVAGANTTFTVSVPKQSAAMNTGRLGPAALALLLLPFAWLRRSRGGPYRLLLWMLVALGSLGAVSGCGAGGYFSQPEQTYTITVTGTSGSLVRGTTVTLTVE